MKKIFLISVLFLLIFLLAPKTSYAQTECESQGGECKSIRHNICPDNFDPTPIGGYGEMDCKSAQACCVPLASGCHPYSLLTGCKGEATRCPDAKSRCCTDPADCPVFAPEWGKTGGSKSLKLFCDTDGNPTANDSSGELYTAIGCIPIESPDELIGFILSWAIGIGGGIAFLLILFAGFQIMTSTGNPERLKAGQELMTSAIAGLLLLVFSVFILKIIGVDILGLPGFGK